MNAGVTERVAASAGPLLIVAPTGRDAEGAAALLGRANVVCRIHPDMETLCAAIDEQAGAVLLADEALQRSTLDALARRLAAQPPWSDLPFIVLTRPGAKARRVLLELHLPEALGNLMFLERPLNALSLVSAVRSALRARQRQRQIGEHLAEQRRVASVLRERETQFGAALAIAELGTFEWNLLTGVARLDERSRGFFGFAPGEGTTSEEVFNRILSADLKQVVAQMRVSRQTMSRLATEYRIVRPDGEVRIIASTSDVVPGPDGRAWRLFGVLADVTEQRRAETALRQLNATLEQRIAAALSEREQIEEALRQSQKMEAVGQLTGGLAHDFNNLLTSITGSLELLATRLSQGRLDQAERHITVAQEAAHRAASLTHRLLAFSRRQTLDPKPTEPNRLIAGMEELVRRTVGPRIAVETALADGLWNTLCDPNQLENALLNLCINARDAMPDGGRLTIDTANIVLHEREAREHDMAPGEYVLILVADTGTGMAPNVVARAFDPFFTTKPLGAGTGLGLSMIYGFVRQSGGQIRISTKLGSGTCMQLFLPRHRGEAACPEIEAAPGGMMRTDTEHVVLVVDDEPEIRLLVVEVLTELGYRTIEAKDGDEGLRILRSATRLDLLITDVGLPGSINGRQVADAGRNLRPGLKVLFITGYAEVAIVGNARLEPGMHVQTKPFALETLAGRVKDILAET